MPVSSFLRTPLTDLTGTLVSHQGFGTCSHIEMKALNCLEAYGQYKSAEKCNDILQDYKECFQMNKQMKRFKEMRSERFRQYRAGERSKDELYAAGPRVDSFQ
uniref:Putative ubiquinone oxidoreductase n=1 Tax=Panstrongylus lignarius TaxID=156445 RepID=A0A224XQN7_9HEMI